MKTRLGFVSNSSSSSFVCLICNKIESGWDLGLDECEMFRCENGHELHIDCLPESSKEEVQRIFEMSEEKEGEDDEDGKSYEDYRYELPSKYCPVCKFESPSNEDMLNFLLKSSGITKDNVKENIRTKFKTYNEFKEYIKK